MPCCRYCKAPASLQWFTTSSKLFMEYMLDTEDRTSSFNLRIEQTRGCILPGVPRYGASISCSYSSSRLVCTLRCRDGWVGGQASCSSGHGTWSGDLTCTGGNSTLASPEGRHRMQRLLACRHERRTGCLAPPPLPGSTVECSLERGEEVCRVQCPQDWVSPADYATCERDRSGWEGRWSRLLLPCLPACSLSSPKVVVLCLPAISKSELFSLSTVIWRFIK